VLAIPEKNPSSDKADAGQEQDRSADKFDPSKIRSVYAGVANFREIIVQRVFHKQETVGGRNAGNDKEQNGNQPLDEQFHGVPEPSFQFLNHNDFLKDCP